MTIQTLTEINAKFLIVGIDALVLVCVECARRSRQSRRPGRGNGRSMESAEQKNSPTLSHRPLEDAGTAGVSHIPPANGDEQIELTT